MMNLRFVLAACVFALVFAGRVATAETSVPLSIPSTIKIVGPLSASFPAGAIFDFGTHTKNDGNIAGTPITITVGGDANAPFLVTMGTPTLATAGGVTMGVTSSSSLGAAAGRLSATGAATFTVGATAVISATQASGTYNGVVPLTVKYQ